MRRHDGGFTIVEMLVATSIGLVVLIAVYNFMDASRRTFQTLDDLVAAQAAGRAAIDVFGSDCRTAGYTPRGLRFDPIPDGNGVRIRFLADLDGDGVVASASAPEECVSYEFADADGDGVYGLFRGSDLNGDWSFTGAGESVSEISSYVVPIDYDGDGVIDPFLSYDQAPPDTTRVRITFGVQTKHLDPTYKSYNVASFQSEVVLRNRM